MKCAMYQARTSGEVFYLVAKQEDHATLRSPMQGYTKEVKLVTLERNYVALTEDMFSSVVETLQLQPTGKQLCHSQINMEALVACTTDMQIKAQLLPVAEAYATDPCLDDVRWLPDEATAVRQRNNSALAYRENAMRFVRAVGVCQELDRIRQENPRDLDLLKMCVDAQKQLPKYVNKLVYYLARQLVTAHQVVAFRARRGKEVPRERERDADEDTQGVSELKLEEEGGSDA